MDIIEKIEKFVNEGDSTENCLKTLKANIAFYEKMESKDDKAKEILKNMQGMLDFYNEKGSFSPAQATAIFNISNGIKKMTS